MNKMNTPINDGGPAFPVPDSHHANGQVQYGANGMTLRDWFAGQALGAMLVNSKAKSESEVPSMLQLAGSFAYIAADAMLAAREKGQP